MTEEEFLGFLADIINYLLIGVGAGVIIGLIAGGFMLWWIYKHRP